MSMPELPYRGRVSALSSNRSQFLYRVHAEKIVFLRLCIFLPTLLSFLCVRYGQ